jgi:hypothetical protein
LEDAEGEKEGGFVPGYITEAVEFGGDGWDGCADDCAVLTDVSLVKKTVGD